MNRILPRSITVFFSVWLCIALIACGGSSDSPTAAPTSAATEATTDSPTAVATDAATAAATEAPTEAPTAVATEEPTAAPSASGEPVQVDALWFSSDGRSVQGGTSRVTVSVRDNPRGDLRVGFFESEVGGSGPQWRSSGWMAVITAALLIGFDPSQYEFSFDVAGRIDGPSAGALMTAAVLASVLGDEVDPNVSMTGTINPDGSVGPVGGIPHKLEGAQAAGKTKILVPIGQRYDYDYALGRSVDLVEAGKALGIEVKLVPDIYAVYRELTGAELPTPESQGRAEMPSKAFDKYRNAAQDWYSTYQAEVAEFNALPAEIQEYRVSTIEVAAAYAADADSFLGEGQVARAFESAFTAASLARLAHAAAELDNIYNQQGIDPLVSKLNASSTAESRLLTLARRLEANDPATASDAVAIMDAFSNLSVAQGLIFQAQSGIRDYQNNPEATEDDALTAIYSANFNYVYADMFLKLAETTVNIGTGFGSAPAPDLEVLKAMSETLRRGAEANIIYFESIIIDPWAASNNVHPELAKYYFQQADSSYLTAVAADAGASSLANALSTDAGKASVTLGSALTAYSSSATLIAKYYSLSAQVDENGYIVGFDRQSPLTDMLDLADQRARSWLNAVANEEPVLGMYYYEIARLQRAGTPEEQLTALGNYWQSTILSETLKVYSDPRD